MCRLRRPLSLLWVSRRARRGRRVRGTAAGRGSARVARRAVSPVFAREDEQTALAGVRRAFETAGAQAAVLAAASGPAPAAQRAEAGPLAGKRAQLNATIQTDQQEVGRLRERLRT